MNTKNHPIKAGEAKSFANLNSNPPKLTVGQIIEKFVKPSSHRKMVVVGSKPAAKKI